MSSKEFKQTYGSLTDGAFVDLVYQNVLLRGSDAAGRTHWVDQLQHHGLTRGTLMSQFAETPEGRRIMAPQVDVVLVHLGLLRALPTAGQFASWTSHIADGTETIQVIADTIRQTSAYEART